MALNVTKILFRRGTDALRRTVTFDSGEPAYSTDTKRLFIGDGQTLGGLPLGMRNLGYVASLTGTYLNTNLSTTAFNAITAGAGQIGDIIYDRTSTYIWSLTSTSIRPALSNFAVYAVYPAINTSDFKYTGVNLTLNDRSIQPKHINTDCLDGNFLSGGNSGGTIGPITLRLNSIGDDRLKQMGTNTVKVNNLGTSANGKNLAIDDLCSVLGRGTGNIAPVKLQATTGANDVTVTAVNNNINFYSAPALKLTGGTMAGNVNMQRYKITSQAAVTDDFQLVNKQYTDSLPTVQTAAIVYDFIKANFLPLSGGTIAGPTPLRVNGTTIVRNLSVVNDIGGDANIELGGSGNVYIDFKKPSTDDYDLRIITDGTNSEITTNNSTKSLLLQRTGTGGGGKVGIGVSSVASTAKLQVSGGAIMPAGGNSNTSGILYPSNSSGDAAWLRYYTVAGDSTVLELGTQGEGLGVNSDNIYLNPTGGVGIGTTGPSQKLDVAGAIRATGNLFVNMGNTTGGGIVLSDDGDIVDLNDGFCSMRFTNGVRVYSGNKTGTPVINLGNTGNITASGAIIAGSYLNAAGYGEFGSANVQVGAVSQGLFGNSSYLALRNFSGGDSIRFQSFNGAATHMQIRSSDGNVGIGNIPSGYKLDVDGDIASDGWLRTRGNFGWQSEDYDGGWYMSDSTWIRNYNSKRLYINSPNYSWFDTTGYNMGVQVSNFNNLTINSDSGRGLPALELMSGGVTRGDGACYMTFLRSGTYGVRFGIDTDNKLKVGGWSMGNVSYEILHTGNYTNLGIVPIIQTNNRPINRLNSGFYETANAQVSNGWPQSTGDYYHLLANTHSNTTNYFSMQFAGNFRDSNEIYYRATNGSGSTTWNKILHTGNSSGVVKRQIIRPNVRSLVKSFLPGVVGTYINVLCEPLTNYPNLVGGTATIPAEGVNIFQGNGQPSISTYVTKAANSLIHFRMQFQIGWYNAHNIAHFRFYVDGVHVDSFSFSVQSYGDQLKTYEYWYQSDKAAGTNITWELKGRSYGGSNRSRVHYTSYWDGAGPVGTYIQPTISIEEHVGV